MVITTEGKIKLLLLRSGKNQGDLADYLGVMKQSLNLSIKSGGLRYSVLQKIAEFFNSELDVYFIVDGKRYTQSDIMSIPKQLHEIATEKCISQKDIGKLLGMNQTSISAQMRKNDWKENRIRQISSLVGAELHIDFLTRDGRI